jgi:hypothetical protein
MQRVILGLALTAWPVLAGGSQSTAPAIALYTNFQHEPSPAIREAVRDEVESIMEPSGLRFEWRSLNSNTGREVSVELAVVSFKGTCEVSPAALPRFVSGPLGWTHVSDGVILPFADVDCDRIRGFVQRELSMFSAEDREQVFGRAIGRVLAHELYHILANTDKHGSCGIGKSAYTVQDLLMDEFEFEGHEPTALRANRPRAAAETVGSTN